MPIFYKDQERVLFSHIPKTAGTSLYVWFAENGWFVSNLKLLPNIGTGIEFRKRFGIIQCQLEGDLPSNVSPQHATKEYFDSWGVFSSRFCIVRHPLLRVISEMGYIFPSYCANNHIRKPNRLHVENFVELFFQKLRSLDSNINILDNHLRPQVDFIGHDMHVLYYEGDWKEWLKSQYSLKGEMPFLNQSARKDSFLNFLSQDKKEAVYEKYRVDYDILGYPKNPNEVIAQ